MPDEHVLEEELQDPLYLTSDAIPSENPGFQARSRKKPKTIMQAANVNYTNGQTRIER